MTARGLFPFVLASVNCSENQVPNLTLLLQPDHFQPFCVAVPLRERSQSQLWRFPSPHEAVTAWETPAAVMAWRYAASRLAVQNKTKHLNQVLNTGKALNKKISNTSQKRENRKQAWYKNLFPLIFSLTMTRLLLIANTMNLLKHN